MLRHRGEIHWDLHSGNPSCVEGGDVEQVCSNLETNPLCLRLLTLSLSLVSYYILMGPTLGLYEIIVVKRKNFNWDRYTKSSVEVPCVGSPVRMI